MLCSWGSDEAIDKAIPFAHHLITEMNRVPLVPLPGIPSSLSFPLRMMRKIPLHLLNKAAVCPSVDRSLCIKCYQCVRDCPFGAITQGDMEDGGFPIVNDEKCQRCFRCYSNVCLLLSSSLSPASPVFSFFLFFLCDFPPSPCFCFFGCLFLFFYFALFLLLSSCRFGVKSVLPRLC